MEPENSLLWSQKACSDTAFALPTAPKRGHHPLSAARDLTSFNASVFAFPITRPSAPSAAPRHHSPWVAEGTHWTLHVTWQINFCGRDVNYICRLVCVLYSARRNMPTGHRKTHYRIICPRARATAVTDTISNEQDIGTRMKQARYGTGAWNFMAQRNMEISHNLHISKHGTFT